MQPSASNARIDIRQAVDELFEAVVFGDGAIDPATQRKNDASRKRLASEQREQEILTKKARRVEENQFCEFLLSQGPDKTVSIAPPVDITTAVRPDRISLQIPFKPTDRSRIPRKTRQTWVNRFTGACDGAFPGAIITHHLSEPILAMESSIYMESRAPATYIGSWVNLIHALKSATNLADFIACPFRKPVEVVEPTPLLISEPMIESLNSAPKKNPCILGMELPYNLFGSDDDDDDDRQQHNPNPVNEVKSRVDQGAILRPVNDEGVDVGDNQVAAEVGADASLNGDEEAHHDRGSVMEENVDQSVNESDNPSREATQEQEAPTIVCERSDDLQKSQSSPVPPTGKSSDQDRSDVPSPFFIECKEYVDDVVWSHLRLRFGREHASTISSRIMNKVRLKVLGLDAADQRWSTPGSIARLRASKTKIDGLAEVYAQRRRNP